MPTNDILITLEGLLKTIVSTRPTTINLYSAATDPEADPTLLITFLLPGYDCLDDFLMDDEVKAIAIINATTINITIDTSLNN